LFKPSFPTASAHGTEGSAAATSRSSIRRCLRPDSIKDNIRSSNDSPGRFNSDNCSQVVGVTGMRLVAFCFSFPLITCIARPPWLVSIPSQTDSITMGKKQKFLCHNTIECARLNIFLQDCKFFRYIVKSPMGEQYFVEFRCKKLCRTMNARRSCVPIPQRKCNFKPRKPLKRLHFNEDYEKKCCIRNPS